MEQVKPQRILFCGDRNWEDERAINDSFEVMFEPGYPGIEVVIEGGAKGADVIARNIARACSIPVQTYEAEWEKYGKAAGPIRNERMLEEGKPDIVFAYHNDIKHSKGTLNMIRQALDAGIEVFLHITIPERERIWMPNEHTLEEILA